MLALATVAGCSQAETTDDFERDNASADAPDQLTTAEPGLRFVAPEGETLTVPVSAQRFETWDDLYAFAIDELGGHPVLDEDGELIGVRGTSVTSGDVRYQDENNGLVFEGRELAVAMLGGADGILQIGDETFPLGEPAAHGMADGLATTQDPFLDASNFDCIGGQDCEACDGGDCISGHSWHTNYWVYKSVGSRSQQSAGGYVSVPYNCCPTGTLVNHNGSPMCRVVTSWLPPEPPLLPKPIPAGYGYVNPSTCYSQTTQNQLTLQIFPHSSGPSQPFVTPHTEFNTREIEVSEWYVGGNVDFGGLQDVDGICGMHFGSRGGISLTRDGNASFNYCDGGFIP